MFLRALASVRHSNVHIARPWLSRAILETKRNYITVDDIFEDDDDMMDTSAMLSSKNDLPRAQLKKGKYVSPWPQRKKGIGAVIGWWASTERNRYKFPVENPKLSCKIIPQHSPNAETLRRTDKIHMTWMGHASCCFHAAGLYFLTDPVFSERASPMQFAGPKREMPVPFPMSSLPRVDVILLSHTHYDHLDEGTARQIGNSAKWIVPVGVKSVLQSYGITNVEELNWWDCHVIRDKSIGNEGDVEIVFTPTHHWTSRTPFDRNRALWGSFAVLTKQGRFFFGGDTAYCSAFKVIGENLGPFDIAALPIGAYKPRWFMKDVHCNPGEALQIHRDIRSKQSIGIHWGTFPLADEDFIEPAMELARMRNISSAAAAAASSKDENGETGERPSPVTTKDFFTMGIGETFVAGDEPRHDLATLRPDLLRFYEDNYSEVFLEKDSE